MTLTDMFTILYRMAGAVVSLAFLLILIWFFIAVLVNATGSDRGRGDGGEW